MTVSTSLMLVQYFVLIDVKVEKAHLHKYIEKNGKKALVAKSDNAGYSTLKLSCNFESEENSANSSLEFRGRWSML